jgi:subtilase family serine protease
MRSRLISRLLLSATLLFTGYTQLAQATVQSRIASVDSGSRIAVHGTISSRAKRATVLGDAPTSQKLNSLTLFFSLTSAQQADLDQLLAAQVNPSSPSYHQWLTPEQFGARFGLSSADLTKVSNWLSSQGFTITSMARSSTFIQFSGTVAQAQQAFGTTIRSLSIDGEPHISNLTDPVLPSAIAGVVTSITGLNDFRMKPHSRRSSSVNEAKPLNTQTINGVVSHFIAPGDLYTIYGFPAYSATAGAGVTIAVMGQTDLTQGNTLPDANVAAFRTAAGLSPINLKLQFAGGTDPGISAEDIDEAHLDVEWSGAAAPGATILFVYGYDAFGNSLTYAVDNKVAPIVTTSYGGCESEFNSIPISATNTQSQLAAYNAILAQANAEGITVMSAAGDDGATDCDTDGLASEGLNVDFPSSSPYVTSAGGTMFSGDVNTPATYWSSTNGANAGSALGYIPEQPWNETNALTGLTAGGAGGGGASAFFSKPSWQMGTGSGATPNDSSRDVPDIALNAAAMHDGYFVCSVGDGSGELPCSNGFLDSTGNPNIFGGTSFVAPTMAGILAQVEQHLGVGSTAATGLGNINSVLYGLANGPTYSSIFHDITSGHNSIPCSQGTPNCPNGGSIGFNAGPGYDQASGLGSLNVANLINGWSSAIPTGIGGTTSPGAISTTSLTSTATATALCGVSGSLALNVSVTGSITGTTPTGTVQFFVDGTLVTGSATTLANGTASYTLATATLSSGGHTIGAVYSGDSNYAGSKGTLLASDGTLASLDIVSTTKPDFSITPCSGAVSVSPGATSTGVAFTITPVNGFTGTVNMTATNNSEMTATTSFTVSPVSITSAAGVSTSFVVVASQPETSADLKSGLASNSGRHPSNKTPWYAAGSGATLACLLLFTLPRRRRWAGLLVVLLSVAALSAVGCSNTSTIGNTTGGGTTTPVTVAAAGTYTFTITGVATGGLVHSTQVTVMVP